MRCATVAMTASEADLSAITLVFLVDDVDHQLELFLESQIMEQTDALLRDMASRWLAYQASIPCSSPPPPSLVQDGGRAMDLSDADCSDTDGGPKNMVHVFCDQSCSHRPSTAMTNFLWIRSQGKGKSPKERTPSSKRELKLIKRSFNRGFWAYNKNRW